MSQTDRAVRQLIRTEQLFGLDVIPRLAPPASVAPAAPGTDGPAAVEEGSAAAALATLAERYESEVVPTVTQYPFQHAVFGEGDPDAALMFIGEGPGADEDRTGRPFVGKAGQKLDEMIGAMGFERRDVYIANIVKIRPPGNRNPLADEIERDAPYLMEQIRLIRPRVIVALGGPAAKFLLDTETGITRLRGIWGQYADDAIEIPVMPTFHPAYLLRNYDTETRRAMWHDLQAARDRVHDDA